MRVLIVGCGYVGQALGRKLIKQGHQVIGLRRTNADALSAAGIRPLTVDITREPEWHKIDGSFDWIVNTVSSSKGTADDYREVYVQGMKNLVAWLGEKPPVKLVYTSSTSVYGQTDGSWVDESSPTSPAGGNTRALLETEEVLRQATAGSRSLPAVILRVAGIYGPGRGYWLRQYLTGEARISGNGERFLNMIHRDDVVGCIIAALEHGKAQEIYNAVDNEPVTQIALFRWLSITLGKEMPPRAKEVQEIERKRAVTNKRVSNGKLKAELGYQFKYRTFREGFAAEMRADGQDSAR